MASDTAIDPVPNPAIVSKVLESLRERGVAETARRLRVARPTPLSYCLGECFPGTIFMVESRAHLLDDPAPAEAPKRRPKALNGKLKRVG